MLIALLNNSNKNRVIVLHSKSWKLSSYEKISSFYLLCRADDVFSVF